MAAGCFFFMRIVPDLLDIFKLDHDCEIYGDKDFDFIFSLFTTTDTQHYWDTRLMKKFYEKEEFKTIVLNEFTEREDYEINMIKAGQKIVREKFHYDNIVKMWENEL